MLCGTWLWTLACDRLWINQRVCFPSGAHFLALIQIFVAGFADFLNFWSVACTTFQSPGVDRRKIFEGTAVASNTRSTGSPLDKLGSTMDGSWRGSILISMASLFVLSAWLGLENAVDNRGGSLGWLGWTSSLKLIACADSWTELG